MVEVQGITQHVAMAIAGSSVYGLQAVGTASSPGPAGDYDNSNKVRQESILVRCVPPAWGPYVLWYQWPPSDVTPGSPQMKKF